AGGPAGRPAVRPDPQREGAGRQPVGLADAGETTMTARGRQSAGAALLIALGAAFTFVVAGAQQPSAVFTGEQAAAGRGVEQASCAGCHMPDLAGRNEAPQLAGNNFMNTWRGRSTRDLFEFIQSTMPPTGANLGADAYLAVTAYILQANGAQPGAQALT